MKALALKSLRFVLFFIAFFIAINTIYSLILFTTDFNVKKRFEMMSFNDRDFQVIVLGASTVMDAIDAEFLTENGFKSYNTAIDGSSVKTNYVQLEEYLNHCSEYPQYVIIGLNPAMVASLDDEGVHPIVDVTRKGHSFELNDVPVLKLKWLGFEFLKKVVSKEHRNAKMVQGQVRYKKALPDNTQFRNRLLNLDMYSSSYWVAQIAKVCSEKDIEFIIIDMPNFKAMQNQSDIGPYQIVFNNGSYAKLFNFNSKGFCQLFEDNKDWIGNSHLNEFGSVKFTQQLLHHVLVNDSLN